jgi:AcrR family transcriptional regulator
VQAPSDPTSTPKPRRRRKDDRPAEIIEAAMGLWAERGFAATRLEDVAARAGIAKGTIYLYFASKEALFEGAVRERLLSMMQATDEMLGRFEGDTAALLTQFLRAVRTRLSDEGAIVLPRILLGEGQRFPALVALYRDVALSRGMGTARAILARGVARGDLRPEAAGLDPRLLLAPVIFGVLTASLAGDERLAVDDAYIDAHVRTLLYGLSARG